mmetsp:Transcript_32047/g.62673  ORF Transcript_32047/g.62673 Transcript_32047/m.62673 type:complete len:136 (+) Transcript_32047:596-1003(+)
MSALPPPATCVSDTVSPPTNCGNDGGIAAAACQGLTAPVLPSVWMKSDGLNDPYTGTWLCETAAAARAARWRERVLEGGGVGASSLLPLPLPSLFWPAPCAVAAAEEEEEEEEEEERGVRRPMGRIDGANGETSL